MHDSKVPKTVDIVDMAEIEFLDKIVKTLVKQGKSRLEIEGVVAWHQNNLKRAGSRARRAAYILRNSRSNPYNAHLQEIVAASKTGKKRASGGAKKRSSGGAERKASGGAKKRSSGGAKKSPKRKASGGTKKHYYRKDHATCDKYKSRSGCNKRGSWDKELNCKFSTDGCTPWN